MRYGLIYVVAAVYAVALAVGGWAPLAVPVVVFGLIPALDHVIGQHPTDPDGDPRVDLWVQLWAPTQVALIAASLWVVRAWELPQAALLAVSLGILTGAGGINVAHELVHRKAAPDRVLGEVLMTSVTYPWWIVEHVLGHHRWVATPRDPATARAGETVYAFVPRSIVGGLVSFLRIERDYAGRRGIPPWSLRDRRTRYALTTAALYGALAAWGGWPAVAFFAAQSAVAVVLLEVINYVEHYGLLRPETAPGEYARVAPEHSWNSNHWLTGALLFNLPRHADHHATASRPFHQLRPWPDAPELPSGYAAMVLLALVPPLWFRTMDPRVQALRA